MTDSIQPVEIGKNKVDAERVPLFIIEGVTYSVLKKPRPNIGLRYMRVLKEEGQEIAVAGLLEAMLGKEAFVALTECEDLTEEEFEEIMNLVQKLALGNKEAPVKN
ncbi:hypothetical protein [Streptomyces sp. LARHCF252]